MRSPVKSRGSTEKFATPHDSTHVLTGYDTTPRGEVLVSTFTAAMHRREPMSGHILPVIFSWHLGIQLNAVAKSATGALDPEAFWLAWDRGAAVNTDTFAAGLGLLGRRRRASGRPQRALRDPAARSRRRRDIGTPPIVRIGAQLRRAARRRRDRDRHAAPALAPLIRFARADRDRAAMDLGDPPRQREAEADAGGDGRGASAIGAIERCEHALALLGRDAGPVVRHGQ